MQPNQTSVTIQEIINLGRKINDVFGSYDIAGVNFSNFLQTEKISKTLIVINFDNESSNMDIHDFCVICKNNWEEFFLGGKNESFLCKSRQGVAEFRTPLLYSEKYKIARKNH